MPELLYDTYARGKLLITGEYVVLDGATALAVPVKYGQSLRVMTGSEPGRLRWRALDEQGSCWLQACFDLANFDLRQTNDPAAATGLQKLLAAARKQNPDFLPATTGIEVETRTDFPRAWGLGTSSTLVAAVAKWADTDPYRLLEESFGGSGYDIACAYSEGPILYRRRSAGVPMVQPVDFKPLFADQLYFVYLGQKQDSREGIRRYRTLSGATQNLVDTVSALTQQALSAAILSEFEQVIEQHEQQIAAALQLPRAKALNFKDYWGSVKSLGAWGGDFVLVTSSRTPDETRCYFNDLGFEVFMPWNEMVL